LLARLTVTRRSNEAAPAYYDSAMPPAVMISGPRRAIAGMASLVGFPSWLR